MKRRVAIILFNLGGPDSLSSVKGFLFNLFYDRHIIDLPNPFRFLLAKLISKRREKTAMEIYEHIGGKSPILEMTELQAQALEKSINSFETQTSRTSLNSEVDKIEYKTFICMRYSPPFAEETLDQVNKYKPNQVILLPLYPQYSITTTLSSIRNWYKCLAKKNISFPTKIVCCYYNDINYIEAHCKLIAEQYKKAKEFGTPRLLFSAHGLPISIVKKGDPYAWQVEQNAEAIVKKLNILNLDYQVCYQSKVGPVKWLEPSTHYELIRAKNDNIPVILVPIAFVSEHSETLVELDIEYGNILPKNHYYRVPTLSTDSFFIKSLKQQCLQESSCYGCPKQYKMCWQNMLKKNIM